MLIYIIFAQIFFYFLCNLCDLLPHPYFCTSEDSWRNVVCFITINCDSITFINLFFLTKWNYSSIYPANSCCLLTDKYNREIQEKKKICRLSRNICYFQIANVATEFFFFLSKVSSDFKSAGDIKKDFAQSLYFTNLEAGASRFLNLKAGAFKILASSCWIRVQSGIRVCAWPEA